MKEQETEFEKIMFAITKIMLSGYKLSKSDKNLLMNNVNMCLTQDELVKHIDWFILEDRIEKLKKMKYL